MTKLDQFESVFKSADKAVYTYDRPTFDRVLLVKPSISSLQTNAATSSPQQAMNPSDRKML